MSFLSYETSQNMLELLHINSTRYEKVPLSSSLGRVLTQDIVAAFHDPQFPTASMDGYALIYEDMDAPTVTIIGENPAGSDEKRTLSRGTCIKTFTGSIMPHGADTLIQIENVTVEDGKIIINEKVAFGSSVRPVGESYRAGDVLIEKGTKIGFAEIGVMAGLNHVMVQVAPRPRVAVIATGSEILDLGENSNNPSQIRSSNNYTLAALFESAGAQVLQLGTVGDNKESIAKSFENALASADILVSTGGVSVGDYDFVKDIIPRLGAEVVFQGVAIKPGKHIILAQKEGKFIVSLPGFAYSSTVAAVLYVLPLIAKMLGKEAPYKMVAAKLADDFNKRSKLTEFTACNVRIEENEYFVDFEGKKTGSSAILTNLLRESALMISGEEDSNLSAGTLVNVILLENF
ncbi:MAG: molybdopterin molybdotransferase MoeA [Sulfurimonas sp.]|nr:molybdopterin molybdotransferase MoeA [Sulfurimonas sp.]